MRKLHSEGYVKYIPGYLSDFPRYIRDPDMKEFKFDAIVVRVSPADANGNHSLGPNFDMIDAILEGNPNVKIIAEIKGISIEEASEIETANLPKEGKERLTLVKVRINHEFFRKTVKLSYDNKCCITGLSQENLLVASHIIPWSKSLKHAVNPENGLCLNALHDKAFDRGLLTISESFKVVLSPELLKKKKDGLIQQYFISYHGKEVIKPNRFMPNQEFLQYHRDKIFLAK